MAVLQPTQPCPPVWDVWSIPRALPAGTRLEFLLQARDWLLLLAKLCQGDKALPAPFPWLLPLGSVWSQPALTPPLCSNPCSRKDPYPAPRGWIPLLLVGNSTGDKSQLEHPSQLPLWVLARPGCAEPKCPDSFSSWHSTKTSPWLFLREDIPCRLDLHIWVRTRTNSKHVEFFLGQKSLFWALLMPSLIRGTCLRVCSKHPELPKRCIFSS